MKYKKINKITEALNLQINTLTLLIREDNK